MATCGFGATRVTAKTAVGVLSDSGCLEKYTLTGEPDDVPAVAVAVACCLAAVVGAPAVVCAAEVAGADWLHAASNSESAASAGTSTALHRPGWLRCCLRGCARHVSGVSATALSG